jgi:hypothetical protein
MPAFGVQMYCSAEQTEAMLKSPLAIAPSHAVLIL